LEKSRVTGIPINELNYHIFYSFFKGLKELKEIKDGHISAHKIKEDYDWGYGEDTDHHAMDAWV
jgi:myosin heavy subunit